MKKNYDSKRIARIYGVYHNPQHQGAVKRFNKTVQIFFTSAKITKRKYII